MIIDEEPYEGPSLIPAAWDVPLRELSSLPYGSYVQEELDVARRMLNAQVSRIACAPAVLLGRVVTAKEDHLRALIRQKANQE